MLDALKRQVIELVSRIRRNEPGAPASDAGEHDAAKIESADHPDAARFAGAVAGSGAGAGAVAGADAGGAREPEARGQKRRSTSYLPPLPESLSQPVPIAAGTAASEHPTANLQPGADPSVTPDERKLGRVVDPAVGGPLLQALGRVGPRAFPFKTLIIGRLQALVPLAESLREAIAAHDHARTAALALALQESCAILADELVHQAAHVTKAASRLEKAVKQRDREAARQAAEALQAYIELFDAAIEARRNAAFQAGEKLARYAVGRNYGGVAEIAPAMAIDSALLAFLDNQVFPFTGGAIDLEGSLTDRALRLQQALIRRDWAMASRIGREMAVQSAIMADPTVKLAVQLIAQARKVREATGKEFSQEASAKESLSGMVSKLTRAVPALTSRLDERLAELPARGAELVAALDHKDYLAALGLAGRISVTAQIARHGIVAKAASLLTVTSALEEAALSGEAETIVALLEGV